MQLARYALMGLAAATWLSAAQAQDQFARMETRMANTNAVLTDSPTAVPSVPIANPYSNTNQNATSAACGSVCSPNNCGPTWFGGAERMYFQQSLGADSFDFDGQTVDLDTDQEIANRSWVGFVGSRGIGVQARFFDYDAESDFTDLAIDVDGQTADGIFASSLVELKAYDFELTRAGCHKGWDTTTSFGVRYVDLDYDFAGQQLNFADDFQVDSSTRVLARGFNGTGITGAIEGRRLIRCRSQLALFWNARGGAVWGNNKAFSQEIDSDVQVDASVDVDVDSDSTNESETLLSGEFQIGLDYSRPIACIKSDVFFRFGLEYQIWSLDNNVELDNGDSETQDVDRLGNNDLELYGPVFSIGVRR